MYSPLLIQKFVPPERSRVDRRTHYEIVINLNDTGAPDVTNSWPSASAELSYFVDFDKAFDFQFTWRTVTIFCGTRMWNRWTHV